VNFKANQTIANFGQIRVSALRTIAICNFSSGSAAVIADVAGYYTA
jgi:hypothetical protein